jgi:hypothetical protein
MVESSAYDVYAAISLCFQKLHFSDGTLKIPMNCGQSAIRFPENNNVLHLMETT